MLTVSSRTKDSNKNLVIDERPQPR
jgi:hypothetical protein